MKSFHTPRDHKIGRRSFLLYLVLAVMAFILNPEPCALSQVPMGFNYQALATGETGSPLGNKDIQVIFGILSDTLTPVVIWEELHSAVKTNSSGVFNLVIGTGTRQAGVSSFGDIKWTESPKYIRIKVNYLGVWRTMGSAKLWSVPYSMVAGNLERTVPYVSVTGSTTTGDSALFVVRNNKGQVVFAVYNSGVRIYVGDTLSKGATKGGFAIGSFNTGKGISQPFFIVSPDSIRAYIDSGLVKARKGGFAIGSFSTAKGGNASYFNVSADANDIINPPQNRILWYPLKNAFLTGRVLIEAPDSVGINSFSSGFESKAVGLYSQSLGYKAMARGANSTSIGYQSVANDSNSFAFGQWAQALNKECYAFGRGAISEGYRSFAFGSAGVDSAGVKTGVAYAKGDYSFAIGQGSKSLGLGTFSIGTGCEADGGFSTAMGYKTRTSSWFATAFGDSTLAAGVGSVSLGYKTAATSFAAMAFGDSTLASGPLSIAGGNASEATGDLSISFGYRTKSSGLLSIALGDSTSAGEFCSIATGFGSVAPGPMSFAGGNSSRSSGSNSLAYGYYSTTNGNASLAFGSGNSADSANSVALGYYSRARGFASIAAGFKNTASGQASVALGKETNANSFASLVIGQYNDTIDANQYDWLPTDPLFVIGNGTGPDLLSNAVTVLKNGCVGLQSVTNPTYALQLSSSANTAVGSAIATTWTVYSDSRLKENQELIRYGLKELMQLVPRQYMYHSSMDHSTWTKDNPVKSIGLVAQEVFKIIPEAVSVPYDDSNQLWGLNYEKLVPVLVRGIQEQHDEIEKYKSENDNLKARLQSLQEEVLQIKEMLTEAKK